MKTNTLKRPTLVLNKNWIAITTTTVKGAIIMMFKGRASSICPKTYQVYDFEDWSNLSIQNGDPFIQTKSKRILAPEVIILTEYDRIPNKSIVFSRKNLCRRDEYTCQYCGKMPGYANLTVDHVVPRALGGKTTWENCVTACENCNFNKGDKKLSESGLRLLSKPKRPVWHPGLEFNDVTFDSWKKFIK